MRYSRGFLLIAVLLALPAFFAIAAPDVTDRTIVSPLYQQRLDEMALQFEGKRGADTRERTGIGEEEAFVFPSEAVSACAASACIASGCGASACAASGCAASGCGGSACGASGCVGSLCGASGCTGSACLGSGCGLSACIGSGCSQSGCVGSACGQSGCVGSACSGCNGGLQRDGGVQFANLGDDVVQVSCPFVRDATWTAAQIGGFEVTRGGNAAEVNWIANGSALERYRVLRERAGRREIVSQGQAVAGLMQHARDAASDPGAVYIVELTDTAGWTIAVSSTGETERRPADGPAE